METIIFFGFGGGVVRGLVGFLKHKYSYKKTAFSLPSFLATVGIAGFVGVVTALAMRELGLTLLGSPVLTPAMALIVGYGGGDFIENVLKIITKNPDLYSFSKKK